MPPIVKLKCQIRERSLAAIVDAVGLRYIPRELDRAALATDLYRVYGAYYYLDGQPPTRRSAQKAMDSFIKDVTRFRLALSKVDNEHSPVLHILALARGDKSSP